MARTVAIGIQDFTDIRKDDCFYVDKTHFIKDWWSSKDAVTLITRPRRFGKTLMLSTVDRFFSNRYTDQAKYFEGLEVWSHADMRALQGTLPVIFVSFANVKQDNFHAALGFMVDMKDRYMITSNRESGFGRYDVVLIPRDVKADPGIIIEFKVIDPEDGEETLRDTVEAALKQIEEKRYAETLLDHGVPKEHIRSYGFAFRDKEVLIGE